MQLKSDSACPIRIENRQTLRRGQGRGRIGHERVKLPYNRTGSQTVPISTKQHGLIMSPFEISKEDLKQLTDVQLEAFIARLAETELASDGVSPSCVH